MASDATAATPYDAPWDYPFEKLGGTHPRTAGARGATISLGRENNIPMMQLMSILSYNAAKHLGATGLKSMQERGRIQTGMVADIVVFDPELFTDNSTYEKGAIPSTGMKAVIVNGQVTVRDDVAASCLRWSADPVCPRSQAALRADLERGVECRILDRHAFAI